MDVDGVCNSLFVFFFFLLIPCPCPSPLPPSSPLSKLAGTASQASEHASLLFDLRDEVLRITDSAAQLFLSYLKARLDMRTQQQAQQQGGEGDKTSTSSTWKRRPLSRSSSMIKPSHSSPTISSKVKRRGRAGGYLSPRRREGNSV